MNKTVVRERMSMRMLIPSSSPYDAIYVAREDYNRACDVLRDVMFAGKAMVSQEKYLRVHFFDIASSIAEVVCEGCVEADEVESLMHRGVTRYPCDNWYYTDFSRSDRTIVDSALLIHAGVNACMEIATGEEFQEFRCVQEEYLESASFANYLSYKMISDVIKSYIPKRVGDVKLEKSVRQSLEMMYAYYIREGIIELEFDDEGNISGEKWRGDKDNVWGATKTHLLTINA